MRTRANYRLVARGFVLPDIVAAPGQVLWQVAATELVADKLAVAETLGQANAVRHAASSGGADLDPGRGAYGAVGWLTGVPDLAAVEAGNAALAADDEWRKLIDRAGHTFQPGVTSSLLRRLN